MFALLPHTVHTHVSCGCRKHTRADCVVAVYHAMVAHAREMSCYEPWWALWGGGGAPAAAHACIWVAANLWVSTAGDMVWCAILIVVPLCSEHQGYCVSAMRAMVLVAIGWHTMGHIPECCVHCDWP